MDTMIEIKSDTDRSDSNNNNSTYNGRSDSSNSYLSSQSSVKSVTPQISSDEDTVVPEDVTPNNVLIEIPEYIIKNPEYGQPLWFTVNIKAITVYKMRNNLEWALRQISKVKRRLQQRITLCCKETQGKGAFSRADRFSTERARYNEINDIHRTIRKVLNEYTSYENTCNEFLQTLS